MCISSIIFWVVAASLLAIRVSHLFDMRNRYHFTRIYYTKCRENHWQVELSTLPPFFVWMCFGEAFLILFSVAGLASTQMVFFTGILIAGFIPLYTKGWYYTREIIVIILLAVAIANRLFNFVTLPVLTQ
jgi:hypothetical protein